MPSALKKPQAEINEGYVLVGPTAIGKTDVAHHIAEQEKACILSADSMLIYQGMTIGTAKPTPDEIGNIPYLGINCVTPAEEFNVGDYLEYAQQSFSRVQQDGRPLIVAGGTGLYVKCLLEGLAELPEANQALRAKLDKLYQSKGIEALQERLLQRDPLSYEHLNDKKNPRRLIRAIELAEQDIQKPMTWKDVSSTTPIVGLQMDRECLYARIKQRVYTMYEQGLLDEVQQLMETYPVWSKTAERAIGYAEARKVIKGNMTKDAAIDKTIIRTRQLAKRQMTWFRHQTAVEWVSIEPDAVIEEIAERVVNIWRTHGPTAINI